MSKLRKIRALVVIFVFVMIFAASFTFVTSEPAQASRCDCWIMYCNDYYCWDVCVPCPPIWP